MSRRTSRFIAAAATAVLAVGGYFVYNIFAAQGQGALAQAPLNNTASVQPAFIMAVDDSNSMTFERIFRGGDGRMQWTGSSFFSSAGQFYNVGEGCANASTDCFVYLFPHSGFNSSYSPGRAIPPLDVFGFARSPTYNAGYFNPAVTYDPWRLPTTDTSTTNLWAPASTTAARADPRSSTYGNSFSTAYNVTYNLEAANGRAVNTETFGFMKGMVIPKGTFYATTSEVCNTTRRVNRVDVSNNDGLFSTLGLFLEMPANFTIQADCQVAIRYFPATFYLPSASPAPAGYKTADTNRPVIANACGPGCDMRRYEIRSSNYDSGYADAIRNYANWFQYHRNRILAMVGSSSHAMGGVENMRVGYFTINNRTDVTMYDVATQRASLFTQIYGLKPNGGTPNRQAVAYLGEQFKRTGTGAPVLRACQKNGGMLFTDGYTNVGNSADGYGNADSTGSTLLPTLPFADQYSGTIADIAASYYAGSNTPLRQDTGFAQGLVPVPDQCATLNKSTPDWKRLDCQKDLHMNFYGVTLGAEGLIYDVNTAATDDPYANPPNWNANGDPLQGDDGRVIDELWHAAVNTRGEFINAKTPNDVTLAMRRVLEAVSAGGSPSGTFALTGARIGTGSLTVSPHYDVKNNGTDWSSKLTASRVTVDAARSAVFTPIWEASTQLPAATARNVYFDDAGTVKKFGGTTISLAGLCGLSNTLYPQQSLCTESRLTGLGATADSAAKYLLGETSGEVRNGGKLRDRTTTLGDIINSTPVISSPIDDFGYRALGDPYNTSYTAYLNSKRTDKRYMVYAGANDGMLHAFDGGMNGAGTVGGNGGRETFAYIPATSYQHMGNLLLPYDPRDNAQTFVHKYFVDGPLAVGDTYYSSAWHTTLVGTTGAGGRGVFALDVTSPDSFTTTNRLWEINDFNSDDTIKANIGYVLGKPVIVPVRTSAGAVSWKAVFGNGYSSSSGKAVLFVVDIGTGSVRMVEAVEAASNPVITGRNGLGNIVVVDRFNNGTLDAQGKPLPVRDGFADTVYAADLKGAVWKFDLTSTATSVTVPAFTTGTYVESGSTYRQPITGGLQVASGENGGVLVMLGTGSFSFYDDTTPASNSQVQSLYGFNDTSSGVITTTLTRTSLAPFTVSTNTASDGTVSRTLTAGNRPTTLRGWSIDLPAGERFVGYPELASGILFMPTYAPLTQATGCSTSGTNWLFGLNPRTGVGALAGVRYGAISGKAMAASTAGIPLDTGGTAPVKDVGVSVVPRLQSPINPNDGTVAPAVPGTAGCWMVVNVAGAAPMYIPYPCGRQSWRQIQ
ncbi:MAG: pilus assembly protein [Stenotrophomonas sp.]